MRMLINFCGESERAECFAAYPPAFGLLLYLRKALSPHALAEIVERIEFKFLLVATGVVRPPQRSKGGDGRSPAGDMSGGGRAATVAGSEQFLSKNQHP